MSKIKEGTAIACIGIVATAVATAATVAVSRLIPIIKIIKKSNIFKPESPIAKIRKLYLGKDFEIASNKGKKKREID